MSKYGVKYQLQFKNVEGYVVEINISPTDIIVDDAVDTTIYAMTPGGTPLKIESSNNDEDKYQQIRAKRAIIQFKSDASQGLNAYTFSQGSDNQWYVEILANSTTLFVGYLMMGDLQQPFQPDPQYVTLTATDHLGSLKEIPWVDYSGINPIGKYRVADIITQCLSKTGLTRTLYAVNNLRVDAFNTNHWYDKIYIDAKTFEKEIGLSEDCYTVLNKILGEDCFLCQYLGNWWIIRLDELNEANNIYVAQFNTSGVYVSTAAGTTYNKSIGSSEALKFANADALLRFIRPHGFIKETFRYDSPLEVPCNKDFARGSLVTTVSPTEKDYVIECWFQRRGLPGAYNTPININSYTKRIFVNDYETERYIYITPTPAARTSSTDAEYIESTPFDIEIKDKFSASIQWRLGTDLSTSSASPRLFQVVLIGDDGSAWILGETVTGDGIHKWFDTSVWTVNTGKGDTGIVFGDQDETQWQSISWDAPAAPVSGKIYFWLNQFYQSSTTGVNTTVYYSRLTFDYLPYINGSYQKYTGQYSKVDRTTTGYSANRDNQVYVSDSPKKIFKGAMFTLSGGIYSLATNWFNAVPFGPGAPPDSSYLHPYGYIQAFSVWNQYKGFIDPVTGRGRGINLFSGAVKNLTSSWPDLIHLYLLTDTNEQTNDRNFMLISYSQDWKSCVWNGTFIEVYNSAVGFTYGDTFTFKYISQ